MKYLAAYVAAVISIAPLSVSASPVHYVFDNDGPDDQQTVDFGDFTVTASAVGGLNCNCVATVSQSAGSWASPHGLGVVGGPFDINPGQVDSLLGTESLTFQFKPGFVATLSKIDFGWLNSFWDGDDEYNLYFDGVLAGSFTDDPWTGSETVSSFMIQATNEHPETGGGWDDFRVKSIKYELAPVPLPAAGWMLLAGVGGLVALKRKRKSAA